MFGKMKQRMIDLEVKNALQCRVIDSLLQTQYVGKIAVRKTSGAKETISNAYSYKGEVRINIPSHFDSAFLFPSAEPIEHFEIVEAEKKLEKRQTLDIEGLIKETRDTLNYEFLKAQIKGLVSRIEDLEQKLAKRNVPKMKNPPPPPKKKKTK